MDAPTLKAVEMTRQIRDQHYEQLAGKSHAERIAFYQEQAWQMDIKVPALLHKALEAMKKPEITTGGI